MARTFVSLALFASVMLLSGVMTVTGLSFTADTVARIAAATPVKTTNLKPSYVAVLPAAKPEDLDIAKSVPVASLSQEPGPLAEPPASTFSHTVAVESLRVRAGPKKTTRQLFSLKGGTPVTVIKEDRGWALITAGGDRIGWVYSKLLRRVEEKQASIQ